MTRHNFNMTENQAMMIHNLVASHCKALKNWIATAVERNENDRAKDMVTELREHEALFAAFNMPAKHEIAKHTGKPLETEHTVRG